MRAETVRLIKIFGTAALAAILAACANSGSSSRLESTTTTQSSSSVNRYLWAASLETIDFMPIENVDPVGGVIITDWHASAAAPNERFRANVLILDSALRADALRVRVFKQMQAPTGEWVDAPVNPNTAREVENAILTRARELRLNSLG
ncbi:MAG: DUF3576 domain-containing protein [Pseudomonadota bacterium]